MRTALHPHPAMIAAGAILLLALGGCHKSHPQNPTRSDAAVVRELTSEDGPAPLPEEGKTQIEDSGAVAGSASGGS